MPQYKNPFEKGHLFIKFDVKFPDNHFANEQKLKALEALLPARETIEIPQGENVEEVDMYEYDQDDRSAGGSGRGEAYASDDDDHEPHGAGVQCAHQ